MLHRRRTRGMKLLETILASLIFSTVSIGLMGLWTNYARAMEKSRHFIVASFLAERVTEECLTLGYNGVDAKATAVPYEYKLAHTIKGERIESVYEVSIDVKPVSGLLGPAKSVDVKVDWQDSTNRETAGSSGPKATSVSLNTVVVED